MSNSVEQEAVAISAINAVLQSHEVQIEGLASAILTAVSDAGGVIEAPTGDEPGVTDVKTVNGHRLTWNTTKGTFAFGGSSAVLMWVESTLAGLWAGMREMVGDERFALALHKQGRTSVDGDWGVIASEETFELGFAKLAEVAASAGWGRWRIEHLDRDTPILRLCATNFWEATLIESPERERGAHFLAGKFSGYGTRLFGTNCWTEVRRVEDQSQSTYEFEITPSTRSLESDLLRLLDTDAATRADLAVAVAQLKSEINERVHTSKALLKAKQRAESATQAKSHFLATISHELRSPLHGILGSLELLSASNLAPKEAQLALGAFNATRALLTLTGDMLDISKIEAGTMRTVRQPFRLQEVVHSVIDLMRPTARSKGLLLHVSYPTNIPTMLLGDEGRIRQILVNLVGNAIKFTPAGYVDVDVSASAVAPGKSCVEIAVRDTGIGIGPKDITQVFKPFTQGDTTARHGGAGLGLSISQALAAMMGGTISVQSALGQGTTFVCKLELEQTREERVEKKTDAHLAATFDAHVLVVDDSELNRMISRLTLQGLGCTVEEASSGEEALDCMAKRRYDLVLMDVMMPGMDGLEATRKFRATEQDERRVIIAMTANAMLGDRERCLDAGMDDYLAKPIQMAGLRRILALWAPVSPPSGPTTA